MKPNKYNLRGFTKIINKIHTKAGWKEQVNRKNNKE